MANTNKPNGHTCHIDISYFVLQEWVQEKKLKLAHIRGVVNPADALTNVLGWTLHCCHVMRMMGHMGNVHTRMSGKI
eukprot:4024927-Ditylum_brightwellii.AAC.1